MDYFKRGLAFPYVIETMDSEPVGMITCQIEQENNLTIGYVTYAVLPDYRNYGLASEALMNMRNETKEAGVESVVLFISIIEMPSSSAKKSCSSLHLNPHFSATLLEALFSVLINKTTDSTPASLVSFLMFIRAY